MRKCCNSSQPAKYKRINFASLKNKREKKLANESASLKPNQARKNCYDVYKRECELHHTVYNIQLHSLATKRGISIDFFFSFARWICDNIRIVRTWTLHALWKGFKKKLMLSYHNNINFANNLNCRNSWEINVKINKIQTRRYSHRRQREVEKRKKWRISPRLL